MRYLKVKVKAGRSWVTICHTLQSQVVSLYETVLSIDLKDDVLRGVCAKKKKKTGGRKIRGAEAEGVTSGACVPNQLNAVGLHSLTVSARYTEL